MSNARSKKILSLALQQSTREESNQQEHEKNEQNKIVVEVNDIRQVIEVAPVEEERDFSLVSITDKELLKLIDQTPGLISNTFLRNQEIATNDMWLQDTDNVISQPVDEGIEEREFARNELNLNEDEEIDEMDLESTVVREDGETQCTQNELRQSIKIKRKLAMTKRVHGQSYSGYKRSEGKITYNIPKGDRKLKKRCNHTFNSKVTPRSFQCFTICEEERAHLFNIFWNFTTWQQKKAYVQGLVCTRAIKRRRKCTRITRMKLEGHDIFIQNKIGENVRVCRTMFLNTLCLGEDTYKRWVKNVDDIEISSESSTSGSDEDILQNIGSEEDAPIENSDAEPYYITKKRACNNAKKDKDPIVRKRKKMTKEIQKAKKEKKKQKLLEQIENKTKNCQKKDGIQKWLDLLPKVPSHYCRSTSKKIYVESSFRSKLHMYNVYNEWCNTSNHILAGRMYFDRVIKENNIAIHAPRKDQCDICSSFRIKNITAAEYNIHIEAKTAARNAKAAAKESANEETLVLTMDLQSVLLCPKTLDSALYYKQKLQVHNFTIFELNDKHVFLYVWHEANGGVTANEFTSCIVDYISKKSDNYKKIILISDGCNYQNRNKTLGSALSDLSKKMQITIEQLFLVKGHTMMEADNVHSVLEHIFKPPIFAPSDYIARMRLARPAKPYNIIVADFSFFLNYEDEPSNFTSIRPGKKTGDATVTDIRQLQYTETGDVNYQLDFSGIWQPLPQRRNISKNVEPKKLYTEQLSISESKYRHLQELKVLIDKDHHPFYDSLTFKADKKK